MSSLLVQCPGCSAKVKVPETAHLATCPKCFNSFSTVAEKKSAAEEREESEQDEPAHNLYVPGWMNAWGAIAFILATFGLLSASLVGERWLTLGLAGLGMVLVLVGLGLAVRRFALRDGVWLSLGGLVSGATIGVTIFAGGLLNRFWGMDAAVPRPDPHKLVAVPRESQRSPGRPLAPGDWADGVKEIIRQNDVVVRLSSVVIGELADKPGQKFLLVNVRLASAGHEEPIPLESFSKTKHTPTLTDGAGKTFAFLEQRDRKLPAVAIIFVVAEPRTIALGPGRYWDCQLVFEAPPTNFSVLKLELPASAYCRKGACKFSISEVFVAPIPEIQKK